MHFVLCTVECAEMRIIMEKAIRKYWPVFVLPTMAAFMIGFIVPFIDHFVNLPLSRMLILWE